MTLKDLNQESDKESLKKHTHEIAVTPVRTAEGVRTHLVGSVHDLTERKRAEEALCKAHENTKTILEKAPFGVAVIGRDRKIKRVNDTALKMAGIENEMNGILRELGKEPRYTIPE